MLWEGDGGLPGLLLGLPVLNVFNLHYKEYKHLIVKGDKTLMSS